MNDDEITPTLIATWKLRFLDMKAKHRKMMDEPADWAPVGFFIGMQRLADRIREHDPEWMDKNE
jgi:hypothetical protein